MIGVYCVGAVAGVTLYTMAVGHPPFMAENELKLVEKVRSEAVRIPSELALDAHLRYTPPSRCHSRLPRSSM